MFVVFDEGTPARLMRELESDVYVEGGDYRVEDLPEAEVGIITFEEGYSTTALIER